MDRYPRIRRHDEDGRLAVREGLLLCFFMRRPHEALSEGMCRALDLYLDAVGPEKLGWYLDSRGEYDPEEDKDVTAEMRPLDDRGWARVRSELNDSSGCVLQLDEHRDQVGGFHVEYYGRRPETLSSPGCEHVVSAVSFWLPTEFLEARGPARIKTLATDIARQLPFDSGYVSLAFNALARFRGVIELVHAQCFRYPGIDVHDLGHASMVMGTRVRGAYWLNFYSRPLLGSLGTAEALRQALGDSGASVEELGDDKLLVSLGDWPEIGGPERDADLRPYRVLAHVLEPHLYEERQRSWFGFSRDQLRRWRRRFLD